MVTARGTAHLDVRAEGNLYTSRGRLHTIDRVENGLLPATNYRGLRSLVAESLRTGIVSGTLRPGARVSEAAIATDLGVSRSPVREALRELEKEGLVRSIPNRGVEVATLTVDDLYEVYAIRGALEALATREAVQGATDADIADLRLIMQQMRAQASASAGRSAFVPLDVSFHQRIRRMARNKRLETILAGLEAQVRLSLAVAAAVDPDPAGFRVEELLREHAEIFEAIEARDASGAEALVARHIERGRERLLTRLKGTGHVENSGRTTDRSSELARHNGATATSRPSQRTRTG